MKRSISRPLKKCSSLIS